MAGEGLEASTASWVGRHSFSRSVCHRIDARHIPDLIDSLLLPPMLKKPPPPPPGVRSAQLNSKAKAPRMSSSPPPPPKTHSTPSPPPPLPPGRTYSSLSLPPPQRSLSSPQASFSSFSDSTSSSPFPSPELRLSDASAAAATTKRVESWSQYLEAGGGEVAAVEKAEEWAVDMSQLFLGHKFACGAHSRLYHGIYKGKAVAVKVMRQPEGDDTIAKAVDRQFSHEVSLLSRLHHRNIVQFVAACKKPPVFCVITEYVTGGSLRGFLHKNQPQSIPLKVVLEMAMDVARGMEYIHSQGVVHGDLKSENLVLDEDMCVKITDFGVARVVSSGERRRCEEMQVDDVGTYRWMAPEMISKRRCSFKVDVYSFGIVLWELATGMVPFEDMTAVQAAYAVVHKDARPEVPDNCPAPLAKLMQACWASNPQRRPSFCEVVKELEHFEEASSKSPAYNAWHCPSERTKYFLGCFTRCKKCAVKCRCR